MPWLDVQPGHRAGFSGFSRPVCDIPDRGKQSSSSTEHAVSIQACINKTSNEYVEHPNTFV